MNLFKYTYGVSPFQSQLQYGDAINGYTSAMWVERYRDCGEFEIKSPLSLGLRDFLPVGTIIGNIDSMEPMIVENHEISEAKDEDSVLTITGRSFESYLENRIVGLNLARANSTLAEYILTPQYSWNHAVKLINDHIYNVSNSIDQVSNVQARTDLPPSNVSPLTEPNQNAAWEGRSISRESVLQALQSVLAIDDCGIRTIRRNTFNFPGGIAGWTAYLIHQGVNRTAKVHFSWKAGDITKVEYLFSDKKLKNSAMVLGRYVWQMVDDATQTRWDKRMMIVDGSDLDGNLTAPPTGTALTTLLGKMTVRGRQALARQSRVTVSQADISDTTQYHYRRDFDVGDLVTLNANYGQIATTRIVEYAEIEDENGTSGHPTLSLPGG
jgi:hypothetical protein